MFLTNGEYCTSFASENELLSGPTDVAVNTNNQLLVLDHGHNSIFTFTLNSYYVGRFGTKGPGSSQLDNPHQGRRNGF